jgi:succinyl-diaminopimelate desuccinylase
VRVLSECVSHILDAETISVGRDGASDAICFIGAGIPAVEFGPVGAGHHGPAEWVSLSSLESYRDALVEFVRLLPQRMSEPHLRIA